MLNNKGGDEEKTEPKENDKLADDKDSDGPLKSSKLDALRGRAKQFASNKYHLIIVLLCIVLFILFLIVIILAVQLGTYKCVEPNECRTADCLKAASSVLARSDLSEDPCDNFWSYSCKNWISQNPIPKNRGSYSVTDQLKEKIYTRIRHLIDLVGNDGPSDKIEMKVKTFYDTCRNMQNIERRFPDDLSRAIHELGVWAAPEYGQTSRRDKLIILSELHADYGIPAFFTVAVEPDDLNPLRNIIKLKPGGLGLPNPDYYFRPHDDVYVKAYKDFMIETMKEMGNLVIDANRFAEEVFNYEKRIAEITPSAEKLRNTKDLYKTMTIRELDSPPSIIQWKAFFQKLFPENAFDDTEIGVLSLDYIEHISRIISSTHDKVLDNYYMWRFMQTFAPLSSSRFRLVANYFKQRFEGTDLNLSFKENWEFCIDETAKYMGHAMGAMYVSHYFPQQSQNELQMYMHKLAASLTSLTHRFPWLQEEEGRSLALSKVRSLFLLSGHPGFVRNGTLDSYYKDLLVTIDIFKNIKYGVYFLHKKEEDMLKVAPKPDYSWTVYSHDVEADYKYSGNQLVAPAGLFESPLFDPKSPLAVRYGVLAAHIANKLAEAFDDKGILYDEYGALKTWLSNDTLASFAMKRTCLKSVVSKSFVNDVQPNPDLTIGSFIADILGVKIAYEAYKQHASEDQDWAELPNIGVSNKQAFFISYAQSLCQNIRPDKVKAYRDSSATLPEELRVLSTLQQLPEFSAEFSCPSDSSMNSQEYCRMW